ncbi:MAG: hypothetical protein Dasosvirus15_3 [Dasosvirus sp.]|uniref:Uncharacterized protein n=1 Tax=Dasosvirus sp. TaxID=2487764 RepID=A0A3G4ZRW2_9VIRU|nr:MAG: hypothetical protein Dasosvirus15_3 [Dasosvirus sp.]
MKLLIPCNFNLLFSFIELSITIMTQKSLKPIHVLFENTLVGETKQTKKDRNFAINTIFQEKIGMITYQISTTETDIGNVHIKIVKSGGIFPENISEINEELEKINSYDRKISQALKKTEENIDAMMKEFRDILGKETEFGTSFQQKNEKLFAMMAGDIRVSDNSRAILESERSRKFIDVKQICSKEFSWIMNYGDCYQCKELGMDIWIDISSKVLKEICPNVKICQNSTVGKIPIVFQNDHYIPNPEIMLYDYFNKNMDFQRSTQSKLVRIKIDHVDGKIFGHNISYSGHVCGSKTYNDGKFNNEKCNKLKISDYRFEIKDFKYLFPIKNDYKMSDFEINDKVLALWLYTADAGRHPFWYGKISGFDSERPKIQITFDDGDTGWVGVNQLWKQSDLPEYIFE